MRFFFCGTRNKRDYSQKRKRTVSFGELGTSQKYWNPFFFFLPALHDGEKPFQSTFQTHLSVFAVIISGFVGVTESISNISIADA